MYWIRHNWTLFSILVLVFAAGWMIFTPPAPDAVTGGKISAPQAGFLAPDFTLQDTAGQPVRLSNQHGKPVLINLWASWCPPCKAEMPAMQKVYAEYSGQGLVILAVNTTYQDDAATAIRFAESLGLTFPILFDLDGSVARQYQVRSMPTSFFIGADGIVKRVVIGGPMSEALLRTEIEQMLEEAR